MFISWHGIWIWIFLIILDPVKIKMTVRIFFHETAARE